MDKFSFLKKFLIGLFFGIISFGKAQNPDCDYTTPYFFVDLTNNPAGVWSSPNVSRNAHCCGVTGPDQCISLDVMLDSNAVGIQIDMIGADPAGSLFYQINCIGNYPGGTIKCISGAGLQHITFCKPGSNKNIYQVTSISKPYFPFDDTVRVGCTTKLTTYGVIDNQTNWNSIYPGPSGEYNSYLSCTNCASPVYTPVTTAPAYIEYQVCGFPQASLCGYNTMVCDTVRIYNLPSLSASVSPVNASFCDLGAGSGVTLTATGIGGLPPYSFTWRNSSNVVVGAGSTYFASLAGNYTVEIKDALYNSSSCPSNSKTIAVVKGSLPVVYAGADQKVCATSPAVSLNGTVQNATGGVWSGGSGVFNPGNTFLNTNYTPSSAEIVADSVVLTLTSSGAGASCTNKTDQVTLFFSDTIKINLSAQPLKCFGDTTTIIANATGGSLPLIYLWNTGSSSSSIQVGEGNYSVVVTDTVGCSGSKTFNHVSPSPLTIGFASTDVSLNGGNDGSASAIITGGTAPYTYLWSNSDTIATIDSLVYGAYSVLVTDANGCFISGSVVINEPGCLGFNVTATSSNILCYDAGNGIGYAIASGGSAPYTYSWNDSLSQTNDTAVNLNPGAYTVTVHDVLNCIQTANISVAEPQNLTNTMNHTDATIVGGNNGSAMANPFGGTAPYTYAWSNGPITQAINSLVNGWYIVTITDANGCILIDSVLINEPPCSSLTLNVVTTNVACFGGNTGSATANVSNAMPPYTILWSNGQTGFVANGLAAGNYTVAITDAINCTQLVTFTISEPPLLSISSSHTDIICYGINNGTIDLAITGGTFPYSFTWSNGASTEDLINLAAGNYSVMVLDQHGCKVNGASLINEPSAMVVTGIITDATCIYGSDGAIDLSVSGGTAPYFYTWSTGAVTQDVTGLQAGGYGVTVTDANSCVTFPPSYFAVKQPDSISTSAYTVACPIPGSGIGLVTIVPSGGNNGSYQVSFDNGTIFQPAGDFDAYLPTAGAYSVIIKDNKSCLSILADTIIIKPEVTITDVNFNKCFPVGATTILVTVTASGGDNGSYSVSYDNGVTFQNPGEMSFNLPIGNAYKIIVKDSSGCQSLVTNISIPDILLISAMSPVVSGGFYNISCNGAADGIVNLTVSGGTAPFSFAWTGPGTYTSTNQNLTGVVAGPYMVTVTDTNGCNRTTNLILEEPGELTVAATSPVVFGSFNVSCNGVADGSINLAVIGGNPPYSYAWVGPGTFYSILKNPTGLIAGTYSVTVTDVNACSATTSITLTQPVILISSATSPTVAGGYNITCNGVMDGAINLFVTGGATPYLYAWTGPGSYTSSSQNPAGIGAGAYAVVVTDANGCLASTGISLTQPAVLIADVNSPTVSGGYNITCNGASNGAINLALVGGTGPHTFSWTGPGSYSSSLQNPTGLGAGTYSVVVTDANACTTTDNISLTQPNVLTSLATVTSNYNGQQISCYNANDGIASVTASGGTTPYSYFWSTSPVQATSTVNNLGANTYTVSVIDVNLCSTTATVALTQPIPIDATASVISNFNGQNISCYGANDGAASVVVNGGTAPYSYSWSTVPIQNNDTALSLGANTYTVSVSDINRCSVSSIISLTQPDILSASALATSLYGDYNISCNGLTDGAIDLVVSGGIPAYNYTWSNGGSTEDLINIAAGAYSVLISDQNGCSVNASVKLSEPQVLVTELISTSNYNGYGISCFGLENGSIDISINGGSPSYQYSWSNGMSTQDVINIGAGTYMVVINDANNCTDSLSVILIQPDPVSVVVDSVSNYSGFGVSCHNSQDGAIGVLVAGGVTPYYYMWNNGAVTEDISQVGVGIYSITVIDANGCLNEVDTLIMEPAALLSTYLVINPGCKGGATGSIDLSLTGGVSPYSYSWDNGATTQDIGNLSIGNYNVIYTDLNSCIDSVQISLTEPQVLISAIEKKDITCYGDNNGFINVFVGGGTKPYLYNWSNGANTAVIDSLSQGIYIISIIDNEGCGRKDTIQINEPDSLVLALSSPELPNGHNISSYNGNDGSIDLNVNGGMLPYSYLWSTNSTIEDIQNLTAGEYAVVVTDNNGCSANGHITLDQPLSLEMPTGYTPNSDGKNDNFVVRGIEAFPDNEITIFNRWGNIVYHKKNYLNEWNGLNDNGDLLPDATYFVLIEIKANRTTLKGYVEMKRN